MHGGEPNNAATNRYLHIPDISSPLQFVSSPFAIQVEKIVGLIDVNGNQLIDYEEFIAATIHLSKLNRDEVMHDAFKHFDKDNSGFITAEELHVGDGAPYFPPKFCTSVPPVPQCQHCGDTNGMLVSRPLMLRLG